MSCYQDKMFCTYHLICKKGKTCPDALTIKVQEEAREQKIDIHFHKGYPKCFDNMLVDKKES
jgi:hypothetical protein